MYWVSGRPLGLHGTLFQKKKMKKEKKNWGLKDGSQIRVLAALSEDQGSVPSTLGSTQPPAPVESDSLTVIYFPLTILPTQDVASSLPHGSSSFHLCSSTHRNSALWCTLSFPNHKQIIYRPHSFSIHLQRASMKTQPFNQKRCRFRLKFSSHHYVIFLFLSWGYTPQPCPCHTNALPLKYSLSSLSFKNILNV